jgi:gluconolactonase
MLLLLVAAGITSVALADSSVKILNSDAHFPEGPVWYRGKLYYVEYDRNTVTAWDGHRNTVFATQKGCGPSAVIPTVRGDFITTCYDNGTIGRISADGKVLSGYTHDKDGNRFVGPNDFAPDAHGGIYFTTSGTPGAAIDAKVFYIAADGTITQRAVDLHGANGLAVSKEGGLLYVVETEDNRLLQFKVGADASLSERRVFVNLDDVTEHVGHIWPDGVKSTRRVRSTSARVPAIRRRRWRERSSLSVRRGSCCGLSVCRRRGCPIWRSVRTRGRCL